MLLSIHRLSNICLRVLPSLGFLFVVNFCPKEDFYYSFKQGTREYTKKSGIYFNFYSCCGLQPLIFKEDERYCRLYCKRFSVLRNLMCLSQQFHIY